MRYILLFFLFLGTLQGTAQDHFKIYHEQTDNGFRVMADNMEFCPISAKINLKIENLQSSNGNNKVFLIPEQTKGFVITELSVIDRKKAIRLGISTGFNVGDHKQKEYDKNFKYYLPFAKEASYWLSQGYNGRSSHQGENALDFTMEKGSRIHAARGGIVVDIEESNSKSCLKEECAKFNNYIVIYHSDGTFAEYTHIRKNGAEVKVGDSIKIGQFIGYSGDVGYATGPHLHFIVFFQRLAKRETLKTQFLIDDGQKAIQLQPKEKYLRQY